ncbi:hypothetical protein RJT34_04667 [Clitoria ternatea]|uniref:Oxidative stress 3 n=1 Tax=Clitoria ternatea TaxID=43366 RepID=A0AAN9Q6F0_CLITE
MNVKGIMGGDNTSWVVKEDVNDDIHTPSTGSISIGSVSEDSINSLCSSSSSELAEDASSSLSTSSSSDSNGPLYELSELMNDLPIKRGLSLFYQGKAQSFSSLATVQSIEDFPKRERPHCRKKLMKSCKSYGGGLDSHRISFTPKATITKKTSRGSFLSVLTKRESFLGGSTPSFAVHKNL